MKRWIGTVAVLAVVAVLSSGCQSRTTRTTHESSWPTYQMETAYTEEDFAWALGEGEATVAGEAFLKTRGGDVKTCAGERVVLLPSNAYTKEVLAVAPEIGTTYSGWDVNRGYQDYRRVTRCRSDGRFVFNDVPAGRWFLSATVEWQAPSQYGLLRQGGVLRREIDVGAAGAEDIVLTAANLVR